MFQEAYEAMTFDDPSLHVLTIIDESGKITLTKISTAAPVNVDDTAIFEQNSTIASSEPAKDTN